NKTAYQAEPEFIPSAPKPTPIIQETMTAVHPTTQSVASPMTSPAPPTLKIENRMPISGKNEGVPVYLMNRAGNLIAVPGIQLELMDDLLRTLPGTATAEGKAPLPDFIFHSVLAEGDVEPNVVKMRVRFQIETFTDAPIAVPLRFNEGILLSRTPDTLPEKTPEVQNETGSET
ncbi:MAG: hypothetical protein Q4C70_15895, partial [Planctomycetia bacterium]|nr:hypothetical protein [Planctomycetia bacterium]